MPRKYDIFGAALDRLRKELDFSLDAKNMLSWAFIGVIMLPFVVFAVPQLVGASHSYIVRSGSMEPSIQTGGVVFVYNAGPESIKAGDVITFDDDTSRQDEPHLTTHRVVEVQERDGVRRFRTKGDNNEDPDPGWTEEGQVIGRVGFSVPYLGYVLAYLNSANVFVLLVVLPAAALVLGELRTIFLELYEMKAEGDRNRLAQNMLIIFSFIIIGLVVLFLTGFGSRVLEGLGMGGADTTMIFGGLMMAAMLLAALLARFI